MIGNRLLRRQMSRHFASDADIPPACAAFLRDVEASYEEFDSDRRLVERSMEVASGELFEATQHLTRQNEANAVVLARLRTIAESLQPAEGTDESRPEDLLEICVAIETLIRRRRETEEMLRAARDTAEAANRAKSEFLATMSHEIRTPMNAIIGLANLLLDRPLSTDDRDFVDTIHDSAGKLLAVIDDILDIARVEAGQLHIRSRAFEIRPCINDVIALFAGQCRSKSVALAATISPAVPLAILADRTRIRQVLTHLLNNAVKFTDRGRITLDVATAHEVSPQHLRFSVQDTGIGIPRDRFERLFQPFTQVDASASRRHGGSGLGLAIGRRLVELMDGTITVESSAGHGSCFSFTVRAPLPSLATPSIGCPPAAFARAHPMRLLVVEDNPVNTKVLLFTLRRFGYTADTAVNGHEALERLAAAHYDAVFMDLQMPGMDGLEAVRQLRRTRPMDVPPYVMALTANARQEDCDACHTVGMHDFLSKPVNPELILGALEQAWAWLGERGLAPPIETSGDPALARAQGRP